jgi:hypothetical protein
MKYLFLLHTAGDSVPADVASAEYSQTSAEYSQTFAAYSAANAAMAKAGVLIECAPLGPSSSATTVRVRDDETILTDGPATEIKEQVGGYTLVDCADLDEALKWAATTPAARTGSVEVRSVIDVQPPR